MIAQVAMPIFRAMEPLTARSIEALVRDYHWPKPLLHLEDGVISRARSILATRFLKTNSDVLFFIDDDIVFDPFDAVALAEKCMTYKLIGAPYLVRSGRHFASRLFPNTTLVLDPGGEPIEAMHLAGGFMAIQRQVLETLTVGLSLCYPENAELEMYPFFQPYVWQQEYLSEDWAFCQRARDAGFSAWVDPTIRLGHIGKQIYTPAWGYSEKHL